GQVEIVLQAGERHAEGVEVCKGIDQVLQRPAEAVNLLHEDHVKLPPMGITHEAVQLGAGLLRTAHALVNILARNLPATAGCVLTQLSQLHFGVLTVKRGDSGVQCDSHNLLLSPCPCGHFSGSGSSLIASFSISWSVETTGSSSSPSRSRSTPCSAPGSAWGGAVLASSTFP